MNTIPSVKKRRWFLSSSPTSSIYGAVFLFAVAGCYSEAKALPTIMATYGAPGCPTCHGNPNGPRAGLDAFLASKTPTCTPPQILQNNICVDPQPTCTPPQVLQGDVCVNPQPTCTPPQVLQGDACVTPAPACTVPQVLQADVCVTPPPLNTIVRIQTSSGNMDIRLFTEDAPITVQNFLSYVSKGSYTNSLIHRNVPGKFIQGGGFYWNSKSNSVKPITQQATIANEFNSAHSNLRGTIAMAKLDSNLNSSTNQWFINIADNSTIFDVQNGGYTVFGEVLEQSMKTADTITKFPDKNAGGKLTQVPIATTLKGSALKSLLKKPLKKSNLVVVNAISTNQSSQASDSDRLFAYLEAFYPEKLAPANALSPGNSGSITDGDNYYRYYKTTNSYVLTANGNVYYKGPDSNNQPIVLGNLLELLAQAIAAGY